MLSTSGAARPLLSLASVAADCRLDARLWVHYSDQFEWRQALIQVMLWHLDVNVRQTVSVMKTRLRHRAFDSPASKETPGSSTTLEGSMVVWLMMMHISSTCGRSRLVVITNRITSVLSASSCKRLVEDLDRTLIKQSQTSDAMGLVRCHDLDHTEC